MHATPKHTSEIPRTAIAPPARFCAHKIDARSPELAQELQGWLPERSSATMTPFQGSLLPYATPATAHASCRQIEAITLTIAPELTARQCFDLQCALSYVTLLLEQCHLAARIPPRTIANRRETVLLYVRDLSRQIVTIAADLTQLDCLTLLEQLVHA